MRTKLITQCPNTDVLIIIMTPFVHHALLLFTSDCFPQYPLALFSSWVYVVVFFHHTPFGQKAVSPGFGWYLFPSSLTYLSLTRASLLVLISCHVLLAKYIHKTNSFSFKKYLSFPSSYKLLYSSYKFAI